MNQGSNAKVKIFSTPTCMYCRMTKDFLDEKEIAYEDINVADNAAAREEMIEKTGQMGVPVINIGEEYIVGFDKERLASLLGIKD